MSRYIVFGALLLIIIAASLIASAIMDKRKRMTDERIPAREEKSALCPYELLAIPPCGEKLPWLSYCVCEAGWTRCRSSHVCECKGVNAIPSPPHENIL